MHSPIFHLIFLAILSWTVSSSVIRIPRSPKGGGGGGGHGSSGGGRGGVGSGRGSSSSGTGRGGSGDTGFAAVSYGGISTSGRNSDYFGGGGGKPITLPSTSAFGGRQMGGGSRAQVPGTRSYGSGYPYSNGDISRNGVTGQPFPFGFWPVYWAGHGHSDEYGDNATVASQRPGGDQVMVELIPNENATAWNTSAVNGIEEIYWMIGDRDSVTALLSILTDVQGLYPYGCSVQNQTIAPFNSSNPSSPVQFDNVIQYYRASSFALAYEGYNNTYATNDTAGLGWSDSSPLPTEQVYSPFLQCINSTITAALPILDQAKPRLSSLAIAGIALGTLFGTALLICCLQPCFMSWYRSRKEKKGNSLGSSKFRKADEFNSLHEKLSESPRSGPLYLQRVGGIASMKQDNRYSQSSATLVADLPRAHLEPKK